MEQKNPLQMPDGVLWHRRLVCDEDGDRGWLTLSRVSTSATDWRIHMVSDDHEKNALHRPILIDRIRVERMHDYAEILVQRNPLLEKKVDEDDEGAYRVFMAMLALEQYAIECMIDQGQI
jgi:hypothetical protein